MRIFNQALSAYLAYDGTYPLVFYLQSGESEHVIFLFDEGKASVMARYRSKALAEKQLAAVQKFCVDQSNKNFFFQPDQKEE